MFIDLSVISNYNSEYRIVIVVTRLMSGNSGGLHTEYYFRRFSMLPVAVVRSSSYGAAVCYVLPVLWMTSCLHMSVIRHVMYALYDRLMYS